MVLRINKMKRAGFTLAEIIITLGIIGVVAAMTMPALMGEINDRKAVSILKQDYSILSQMMLRANDDGAVAALSSHNDFSQMEYVFKNYFLPYINTIETCYDTAGCWSQNITKKLNGSNATHFQAGKVGSGVICFSITNGSNVCLDDYSTVEAWSDFGVKIDGASSDTYTLVVFVDINGHRIPNVLGRDTFVYVLRDNTLVPAGFDKNDDELRSDCKMSGTGNFCAAYLEKNGYKLDY